ncbi:MAG: hypothetical protein KatS3mg087_0751 [Patescibacteria group bacterium]|nr:MAG: hypothetical protein KatS3mg087_0751 [Patescibacteria group bacterium]
MTLLINVLIFSAALFALIKAANFITEAAIEISKHFGLPRTVVGATIIALITTLPETITAIMAGIQGHNNLGIGNAFGTPAAQHRFDSRHHPHPFQSTDQTPRNPPKYLHPPSPPS